MSIPSVNISLSVLLTSFISLSLSLHRHLVSQCICLCVPYTFHSICTHSDLSFARSWRGGEKKKYQFDQITPAFI